MNFSLEQINNKITANKIVDDIKAKVENLEIPIGNKFILTYNEPFDLKVFEFLLLWGIRENKTYNIIGNEVTILNTVDEDYNNLTDEKSFIDYLH